MSDTNQNKSLDLGSIVFTNASTSSLAMNMGVTEERVNELNKALGAKKMDIRKHMVEHDLPTEAVKHALLVAETPEEALLGIFFAGVMMGTVKTKAEMGLLGKDPREELIEQLRIRRGNINES